MNIWENKTLINRIISRKEVNANGCWIWSGYKLDSGYGAVVFENKKHRVHRLSWMIQNKSAIPDGYCICHKCDTPACFNPNHLFLGTQTENFLDMWKKGRSALQKNPENNRGFKHPNSCLDEGSLKTIRELRDQKYPQSEIALRLGVSQTVISRILRQVFKETGKVRGVAVKAKELRNMRSR